MKTETKIFLIASLFSIIFLFFIINLQEPPEPKEFVKNKTFTNYSTLFFNYKIIRYPSSVEIEPEEENETLLGFVTDSWNLNFGIIPGDGSFIKRNIEIANLEEVNIKIILKVYGNMSSLIFFRKNNFVLKPNERAVVDVFLFTNDTLQGNYSGEIDLIAQKPIYNFLSITWLMEKKILVLVICFLLLIKITYSSIIEVGITESIKGKVSSITYDNTSNLVKFPIEFYNTGSVGYKTRIKIEIFDNDNIIFNAWSQEKDLMPGERETFDIYWYNNNTGEYFAKLKAYFGNEIKNYEKFGFLINKPTLPEDIFEIRNFRTYDNYVIFDIQTKEDVKDVIIMPDKYISGWIFEQKKIDNINKDNSKFVILPFYPTLWTPSNVKLAIASDNGKYYTEKTLEMKKNGGLTGFFYYIIDGLRIIFSK